MTALTHALARMRQELFLPVLMKEMRSRMRGARTPMLLLVTTALAIVVSLFVIVPQWEYLASNPEEMMQTMPRMGRGLFYTLLVVEMIVCCLIAPALTAGAFTIEREQQTLEMLLLTRLSGNNIVLGKLLSSLSFALIILLCALPVMAIAFLLGGVSPRQLGWGMALIVSTVLLFGAIGLFCSARGTRTSAATATAYLVCFAWLCMVPFIGGLLIWLVGDISDYFNRIGYVILFVTLAACLAIIPSGFCYAVLSTLTRRPLSRFWTFALLFCFTLALVTAFYYYSLHHSSMSYITDTPIILLGNPVVALYALLDDSFSGAFKSAFLERYFFTITVAASLLGAWVFGALTVAKIEETRGRWAVVKQATGKDAGTPDVTRDSVPA